MNADTNTGLDWDLTALENGDGPSCAVAYGPDGNELFWVRERDVSTKWSAHITRFHALDGERIPGLYPTREAAQEMCDAMHRLAQINHQYND